MSNVINTAEPLMVKELIDCYGELPELLFSKVGEPHENSTLTYNLLCAL